VSAPRENRPDLELPVGGGWTVAANAISLIGLALLVWGVVSELVTLNPTERKAAVVLLTTAALSWLTWTYVRSKSEWGSLGALAAMALAGGALAGLTPVAMVFPAVAVLSGCSRWDAKVYVSLGAAGLAAMAISVAALGRPASLVLGGLAAILGGAIVGITRRQAVEMTEKTARMEVEVARAEVERARAELLAERNHLARELHDVLAHTLAALSLQLEAFGTVVDADPTSSQAVRDQLERTSLLVREGLEEARGAVRALREEPAPLAEQLAKLCARHQATYAESGSARSLEPAVVLGLYRVAQEALTNVVKHAPGTSASVALAWTTSDVSLTIANPVPAAAVPAPLAASGGGYGLRGIAERLELLGGTVASGPTADGWRVAAVVPLGPAETTVLPEGQEVS
jgi:signal transduction histidine kinase